MEVYSLKWEGALTKKPAKKSKSPVKSEELIEALGDDLNVMLLKHLLKSTLLHL